MRPWPSSAPVLIASSRCPPLRALALAGVAVEVAAAVDDGWCRASPRPLTHTFLSPLILNFPCSRVYYCGPSYERGKYSNNLKHKSTVHASGTQAKQVRRKTRISSPSLQPPEAPCSQASASCSSKALRCAATSLIISRERGSAASGSSSVLWRTPEWAALLPLPGPAPRAGGDLCRPPLLLLPPPPKCPPSSAASACIRKGDDDALLLSPSGQPSASAVPDASRRSMYRLRRCTHDSSCDSTSSWSSARSARVRAAPAASSRSSAAFADAHADRCCARDVAIACANRGRRSPASPSASPGANMSPITSAAASVALDEDADTAPGTPLRRSKQSITGASSSASSSLAALRPATFPRCCCCRARVPRAAL